MSTEKKTRGRKRIYESGKGAPHLHVRVSPDVVQWVESRPEGARAYLETLIRLDRDRQSPAESATAAGELAQNSGEAF